MNNRQEYNRLVEELKQDMKQGPVEILTGPCRGLVVSNESSLRIYKHRL